MPKVKVGGKTVHLPYPKGGKKSSKPTRRSDNSEGDGSGDTQDLHPKEVPPLRREHDGPLLPLPQALLLVPHRHTTLSGTGALHWTYMR